MSSVYLPVREPIMLGATMLDEVARVGVAPQGEGTVNYLVDVVERHIAERFEQVFGVTLGEYYATIQRLKQRGAKVEPLIGETIREAQGLATVPQSSIRKVKHG